MWDEATLKSYAFHRMAESLPVLMATMSVFLPSILNALTCVTVCLNLPFLAKELKKNQLAVYTH